MTEQGSRVEWVVVTGLSGSGKTLAVKCFEDMGYFCVDNLPLGLLPAFRQLVRGSRDIRKVALVVDVREGSFLQDFPRAYKEMLGDRKLKCTLVFFEAATPVLLQRFSESRRRHPLELVSGKPLELAQAIEEERRLMLPARELADVIMDTTNVPAPKTRERLLREFGGAPERENLHVTLTSFGFKHGVPATANLVFDVRFLPNPHYDDALRPHDGLHPSVQKFLHDAPEYGKFMEHVRGMLEFLLPLYEKEGRSYLGIAVGCTGGRHRSVTAVADIAAMLAGMGRNPHIEHRDKDAE